MSKTQKIYSNASLARRRKLIPVMAVMIPILVILQMFIDPTARKIHQGEKSLGSIGNGMEVSFMLLPLLGFREAAAGLLWVRCDEFFHSGDYDAILPLVRLATWLDPHADNIYVTGAWHLSYNFTDSSERSDRRYLPPAMTLLSEGIANNMNLANIKFEKAWEEYDKMKEFNAAAEDLKLALATPPQPSSEDYPFGAPLRYWHTLAHIYEKQGRLPEALSGWQMAMKRSEADMKAHPKDWTNANMRDAERHNYAENLQRYKDRYVAGRANHTGINPGDYPAIMQPDASGGKPGRWDVAFHPTVEITRPKVFKIHGLMNVADGARVDVRIMNEDYKATDISTELNTFDVPSDVAFLVDSISVRGGKFTREMDMSRDPKMYNFVKPWYRVILSFNSRTTSPFIQDRFGWSGEGITNGNKNYVYVSPDAPLKSTRLTADEIGDGPMWNGVDMNWRQGGLLKENDYGRDERAFPNSMFPKPMVKVAGGQKNTLIRVVFRISREQILRGNTVLTEREVMPPNS